MYLIFYHQDPNLPALCHAVYTSKWPGAAEVPFGLDYTVSLLKSRLRQQDFMSFFNTVLFWAETFVIRRLWWVFFQHYPILVYLPPGMS